MVKVSSRRGEVTAKAEVVDRTVPGVVFMTFHFKEAAANMLTIAALDPVAKIPEFKACAVKRRARLERRCLMPRSTCRSRGCTACDYRSEASVQHRYGAGCGLCAAMRRGRISTRVREEERACHSSHRKPSSRPPAPQGAPKPSLPVSKQLVLGFLAGAYIAFGGLLAIVVGRGSPALAAGQPRPGQVPVWRGLPRRPHAGRDRRLGAVHRQQRRHHARPA